MPTLAEIISVDEYLKGERISEIKYEYMEGLVYAMAGAKLNHNRITRNLLSLLWNSLKGSSCEPIGSDMLLKTKENHYRYPDIMVICNNDNFDDDYVCEAPVLIIEVLSKSTRKKDKTEKRMEYIGIESLQEYVLIEQDFSEIDVQRRSNNWQSSYYFLGDEVRFESIGVSVSMQDIYQQVDNKDIQEFLAKERERVQETAEKKER